MAEGQTREFRQRFGDRDCVTVVRTQGRLYIAQPFTEDLSGCRSSIPNDHGAPMECRASDENSALGHASLVLADRFGLPG